MIPETENFLITDLKLSEQSENVRSHAMSVLQKHMFIPKHEWEFKVISIISGFSSEKLKTLFNLVKLKVVLNEAIKKSIEK